MEKKLVREIILQVAPSHKTEVKTAASRLPLTVVVELLNAALAASTVRVILPSVLFLRATDEIIIPHASIFSQKFLFCIKSSV